MKLCVDDIDARLVEAVPRDDAGAGEALIERYGHRVYRLALRITGVREDAEDVAAQALQTAEDTIERFTSAAAMSPWLYRVVARTAYRKLRNRRWWVREIAPADALPPCDGDGRHFEPMDDWSKRIDEPALQGGLRRVLNAALDGLPAPHRTALVLHDVEGMSKLAIAGIMDVDVPAVQSHVHRARLFVRQRLSSHFESA